MKAFVVDDLLPINSSFLLNCLDCQKKFKITLLSPVKVYHNTKFNCPKCQKKNTFITKIFNFE